MTRKGECTIWEADEKLDNVLITVLENTHWILRIWKLQNASKISILLQKRKDLDTDITVIQFISLNAFHTMYLHCCLLEGLQ